MELCQSLPKVISNERKWGKNNNKKKRYLNSSFYFLSTVSTGFEII